MGSLLKNNVFIVNSQVTWSSPGKSMGVSNVTYTVQWGTCSWSALLTLSKNIENRGGDGVAATSRAAL